MIRGGEHNKRVRIERITETRDPSGEPIETWTTWKVRWAKIAPLTGSERYLAHQTQPELQYKVEMRYVDGMMARDRLNYRGLLLDPISIMDRIEGHREMILMCKEWTN